MESGQASKEHTPPLCAPHRRAVSLSDSGGGAVKSNAAEEEEEAVVGGGGRGGQGRVGLGQMRAGWRAGWRAGCRRLLLEVEEEEGNYGKEEIAY